MNGLVVALWAQGILCILALIFNAVLTVIVYKTNQQVMGLYKWMLIGYSCFEMIYAMAVLQTMPVSVKS